MATRTTPQSARIIDAPRAVLDTQVVLDWLVFRDVGTRAMAQAVENGSLRWLASQAMLDEIEHVLDRGVGAARRPDRDAIRSTCRRLVLAVGAAANATLRCTDPDDQMFVDLALEREARWLFTRDKALLRLARRARDRGVIVVRPAQWQMPTVPTSGFSPR